MYQRFVKNNMINDLFLDISQYPPFICNTISQYALNYNNLELDYLFFLEQYLRVLLVIYVNTKFIKYYWIAVPWAEPEFIDSVVGIIKNFPEIFWPMTKAFGMLLFMNTADIDSSIWEHNLCYGLPLLFFFFKSSIHISLYSLITFKTYVFGYITFYLKFLYELFLLFDIFEEFRMIFTLVNLYNVNFFLNIIYFSLKYHIFPFFSNLSHTFEYFFIPFGLLINFILAFLLLFFVYIINRGTVISDLEKTSAYECGFDPFKDSRQLTDINFFRIAILFILFDLEIIYLVPWIFVLYTSFYNYYIVIGGFCYLFILSLGLFFEYKSKMLDW
jgi:NADH:ubiquinone oxidoreductase subunit 3 (subunit A)